MGDQTAITDDTCRHLSWTKKDMQFSCLDVVLFSSRVWLVVAEFVADTFVCWQHRSPRNSLRPRGTWFSLPPVATEFREGPLPHLWRTSPGWSVPQSWGREVTRLPLLVETWPSDETADQASRKISLRREDSRGDGAAKASWRQGAQGQLPGEGAGASPHLFCLLCS